MSTVEDLNAQVEAYTSLMRHPGWRLLQVEFKKRIDSSLAEMERATNNEDLARHTTAYLTARKLVKVAETTRDTLAQKLQVRIEKL